MNVYIVAQEVQHVAGVATYHNIEPKGVRLPRCIKPLHRGFSRDA